jgi:signal transduction histidine kinase
MRETLESLRGGRESIPFGSVPDFQELDSSFLRVARCLVSSLDATWAGVYVEEGSEGGYQRRVQCRGSRTAPLPNPLTSTLHRNDPVVTEIRSTRSPVSYRAAEPLPVLGHETCGSLGLSTVLALPVEWNRRIAGIALVVRRTGHACFTGLDEELGMMVAASIGPLIELEWVRAEWQQFLVERRTLRRITSAVFEGTNVRGALELVCREAQQLTEASGSAVLLLDDDRLCTVSTVGDGCEVSPRMLEDLMGREAPKGLVEPVLLSDLADRLSLPEGTLIRSMIAIPLIAHGKEIGVLQLINAGRGLEGRLLRSLTLLAERVAIAVEHLRLHEKHEKMLVLEERHRLARDLHDSVTQSVYAVTVFAEAAIRLLDRDKPSEALVHLKELREAGLKALREMRALIFELHPPSLGEQDLISALQARLDFFESRTGIRTKFQYDAPGELPDGVPEGLYYMALEALSNSIRHADASRVTLRLTRTRGSVCLEVRDNGIGFNLEAGRASGGLGLQGMEERAREMQATLDIESAKGHGTRVTVEVPISGGTKP